MKLLHIVGRQNHGKTTLIVDLVEEYARRGIAVGTIKHSSHAHELDTPGKDSYRHRQAGAAPAAVVTPELLGVWLPRRAGMDPYAVVGPMFSACRLVLVEGHLDAAGLAIEVWREAVGGPCLAATHGNIHAVISDDAADVGVPVWPRSDIPGLARRLLDLG
jgi:molybdopterin-guanine dinucleotide biosynthesis protein B